VLSFVDLVTRPEFAVTAATCRNDHTNWSAVESHPHVQIVLVRQGRFRRRVRGVDTDVDPTVGDVGMPSEEEHFAHPAGGDVCTSISLTPALWRTLAGDTPRLTTSTVYVDARLDLAHRRLLATTRTPDVDYAGAERLTGLVRHIVDQVIEAPAPADAAAGPGDRALVAAARDLIRDAHSSATGLLPLAAHLDVSPYRLSRAFTRQLGVSLTRYRNRVRVTRALDRLEVGENRLGALAADLGFADQAHLTRTVRDHLGHTPTALRRLLAQGLPDT
jgi:AraC-like DNA-binding protein